MILHGFDLLFHVCKKVNETLVQLVIRTKYLHAHSHRYFRFLTELDNRAVLFGLQDLFAVFEIDVVVFVCLVMLKCEAIAWFWTLAAQPSHLRTNHIHT